MHGTQFHVEIQSIALNSKNHRKIKNPKNDEGLKDLAKSIKAQGVLQPILLTPCPDGPDGCQYRLVAGSRRLQASLMAGLTDIPVWVKSMTEQEESLAIVIENLQREDIDTFDQATAVKALLDKGADLDNIADSLGKTVAWVKRRANLQSLTKGWRQALKENDYIKEWPINGLELIAGLPPEIQDEILEDNKDYFDIPNIGQIREMIKKKIHLLTLAPWDLEDETLVPKAGSCKACPKVSSKQKELFDEIKIGKKLKMTDRCLDANCFRKKSHEYLNRRIRDVKETYTGQGLVMYTDYPSEAPPGLKIVESHFYVGAKKTDKGAIPALIVGGPGLGGIKWIRIDKDWVSAEKAQRQQLKDQGLPLPLKERRQKLDRRRLAFIIQNIINFSTSNAIPHTNADLFRLILILGTPENSPQADPRQWRDWEDNAIDVKSYIDAALADICAMRLTSHADPKHLKAEAQLVATLYNLKWQQLETEAAKELPEPQLWSTLNPDGTPKNTKGKVNGKKRDTAKTV